MDVNYKPTPTAKRFHQDPNFVRGLLGPLGCLSADTEFLTEKGWKRVDQYEEGDRVAQWWPDTKTTEFVEPLRYIKEPCNEMWHFYTKKSLSMMLSDEHRVPYYDEQGSFLVDQAYTIAKQNNLKPKYIPSIFDDYYTIDENTIVDRVVTEDGFKYCFEVPSSYFVVRHSGCVFVTGNSGKSVACVMEMLRLAYNQEPFQGYRFSRNAIIRSCFDDQTEILTQDRGWVYFEDLKADDLVAAPAWDGELRFEEPINHFVYDYNGEMYGIDSEGVDLFLTPEHNCYVSRKYGRKAEYQPYELKQIKDIFGTHEKYRMKKVCNTWHGVDYGYSDDFYELLGYIYAEGYCARFYDSNGTYRKNIRVSTQNDLDYAKNLLERNNLTCNIYKSEQSCYQINIGTSKNDLRWLVDELCDAENADTTHALQKCVPDWIKNSLQNNISAFLHGFLNGDGGLAANTTVVGYTSSSQLADDLQEMATKAGLVAQVYQRDGETRIGNGYSVGNDEYTIHFIHPLRQEPKIKKQHWYSKHYSGKVYCVHVSTNLLLVRRNGKVCLTSNSYPELKSTTIKTFQEWIPHSVCPIKMDSPISGRMRLPDIGDGTGIDAEFIFLALDQPKDIEKLKSLELTFAWINECSGVRQEMFDMLTLRVGRFPPKKWGGPTRTGVIIDSNMVDDMHWLYQVAEEETPENYAFYRQPPAVLRDPETNEYKINPQAENIENLGEEYYLRAIPGKRWDWINVFLMANWGSVVEGKPVYPEWQDHLHVSEKELKPTRGLPIVVGFDFGLSPAAIFTQLTPNGQIHILDELVTTQRMGIRRFMQDMFIPKITNRFYEHNLLLYGDPSGVRKAESDETTCFHEMANMGYPCEPADSNALEARLNAVAGFLNKMVDGKPAMELDKRCQFLRKGFNGAYHYKRLQTRSSESGTMDKFKEEPEKNDFSHPHDALQYACLMMEGKSQRRSTQRAHRQKKKPASAAAGY